MMSLYEELAWRGLTNQTTFADPQAINEPRTFYLGVDPSAASMHVGNLAQIVVVRHLIEHGHKPIVLVGGATGMIGDPKQDAERDLKSLDEVEHNKQAIRQQYESLFGADAVQIVDNYDWFQNIGYLPFLRDIGKHFSMTQLLDRDFIKSRIGEGGVGISYAEFSYSLIQGYDFLHLFREYGATLQVGGSDQWGNMLSGAQMIKKLENAEAHVWTVPLIVDKTTGKKYGKSEGNAVWLDPAMTSPYAFYQFWLNSDDAAAEDLIKIYTFLDREAIEQLIQRHRQQPHLRELQKTLAAEVSKWIHGYEKTTQVQSVIEVLFGGKDFDSIGEAEAEILASELPTVAIPTTVIDALTQTNICSSNGEARRLIQSGAISLNGQKITDDQPVTQRSLLKKGKNQFVFVRPA